MTDINVWLKDLLPRTPGVSRTVATREFRLAAREFFSQSRAWRETLPPVAVVADQAEYTPVPTDPTNSELLAVDAVEFNGRPLNKLAGRPPGTDTTGISPWAWFSPEPGAVSVWPTPNQDQADGLRFHISLVPTITATVLPDWVFQRYYDALLDGTLGRLYAHPAKAYSNLTGAEYHLRRFRTSIQQASGDAKQGHNNAQNWSFPRFGK
jgi:hypothetical protein